MAKANILIADDDEEPRNMFGEDLIGLGYKVTIARNGQEAIKAFKDKKALEEKIDLIFLDIRMPEPNGIEVGKFIRENHPETKIFYITGYGGTKEAHEIGDKVITKPYFIPDVLKMVENMFMKKKIRILIAEDEEPIREIMSDELTESGYEVIQAKDGADAMNKLQGIDLAMLDIKMPFYSGIEVGIKLREISPNTKIMYVTASLEDKLEMARKIGDKIIEKPFDFDVLKNEIRKLVGLD